MVHDAPDAHDAHAIGMPSFDPVICQSAWQLLYILVLPHPAVAVPFTSTSKSLVLYNVSYLYMCHICFTSCTNAFC